MKSTTIERLRLAGEAELFANLRTLIRITQHLLAVLHRVSDAPSVRYHAAHDRPFSAPGIVSLVVCSLFVSGILRTKLRIVKLVVDSVVDRCASRSCAEDGILCNLLEKHAPVVAEWLVRPKSGTSRVPRVHRAEKG